MWDSGQMVMYLDKFDAGTNIQCKQQGTYSAVNNTSIATELCNYSWRFNCLGSNPRICNGGLPCFMSAIQVIAVIRAPQVPPVVSSRRHNLISHQTCLLILDTNLSARPRTMSSGQSTRCMENAPGNCTCTGHSATRLHQASANPDFNFYNHTASPACTQQNQSETLGLYPQGAVFFLRMVLLLIWHIFRSTHRTVSLWT